MKKLLFFTFFWLVFTQFQCEHVPYTYPVVTYKVPTYKNSPDSVTVMVQSGEFVVNMPNSADSVAVRLYLEQKRLTHIETCPCSDSLQLWGYAGLAPDNGTPPPPPPSNNGDKGNIYGNIFVMVEDSTLIKTLPTTIQLLNESVQPPNPSQTVIVGIDDTGIDLTEQPTNPSTLLFRNNNNPLICNSNWLREGIYGMDLTSLLFRRNTGASIWEPQDLDGHGTFINGVLSGTAVLPHQIPNTRYIGSDESIALQFLHVKFVPNRQAQAKLYDALCGVHYALEKGAKVINASWRAQGTGVSHETMIGAFRPTMNAIKNANALLVTSAGNDHLKFGQPNSTIRWDDPVRTFPAFFSSDPNYSNHVITVGAWELAGNGSIPYFSNEDYYVDIYAPGVDIVSSYIWSQGYDRRASGNGTSYATPYITRIAAILHGLYPCESWANIKKLIKKHSEVRIPYENASEILLLDVPNIMANRSKLAKCKDKK